MKPSLLRPRLLPVCAVIVALFLSTRIGALWQQVTQLPAPAIAAATVAQAAEAEVAPAGRSSHEAGQPVAPQARSSRKGKPAAPGLPTISTSDPRALEQTKPAASHAFSPEEVAALQELAKRREAIDSREQELDRRDVLLHAAETRLDDKVKELRDLQRKIEGSIAALDAQQEAKLKGLVKIYEAMKPKDAARIFDELDIATLLPVVERMNERRLAPIMAAVTSEKAKQVTVELKKQRDIAAVPQAGDR